MDYEKKYKEALSWIKGLYPTFEGSMKEDAEHYFPELKESEDERIRKELIAEVKEQIDCIPAPDCRDKEDEKALKQLNKWLAWLEDVDYANKEYWRGYRECKQEILDKYAELEKQGEQKPAEEYNITGIGSKNAQGKLGEMIKNLKPVNEILEQKPAWSEEDEKILNLVIARLHSHSNVEAEEYDKEYHWLKSLKDRVQPKVKQEWSEEDKCQLESIIECGEHHCHLTYNDICWLKSFKDRVQPKPKQEWSEEDRNKISDYLYCLNVGFTQTAAKQRAKDICDLLRPQKQWKPSSWQMNTLEQWLKDNRYNGDERYCYPIFDSLYQDLKKLMEK